MKICCQIKNGNSDFKKIILRKFYQVIFLNDDKQSLDIYTGIVTSGCIEDSSDNNYISDKFNLQIDINVKDVNVKKMV